MRPFLSALLLFLVGCTSQPAVKQNKAHERIEFGVYYDLMSDFQHIRAQLEEKVPHAQLIIYGGADNGFILRAVSEKDAETVRKITGIQEVVVYKIITERVD